MTRSEVRTFVKAGLDLLAGKIGFGNGRISEFNSQRSSSYPYAWLESLEVDSLLDGIVAPQEDWQVVIHIAKLDKADSSPDQYEAIIDECDLLAQKLTKQYHAVVSGYKTTTIDNISRTPFIKKHADCTTGVILAFTLTAPDTASIC